MADEEKYRPAVIAYLREFDPDAEFGSPMDWMVVYAIATEKPGQLSQVIPFFSKVNLDRTARSLRAIGVRIALAKVPLEL